MIVFPKAKTNRTKQLLKKQPKKVKKIFKKINLLRMKKCNLIRKIQTNLEKNLKRKRRAKNNMRTTSK